MSGIISHRIFSQVRFRPCPLSAPLPLHGVTCNINICGLPRTGERITFRGPRDDFHNELLFVGKSVKGCQQIFYDPTLGVGGRRQKVSFQSQRCKVDTAPRRRINLIWTSSSGKLLAGWRADDSGGVVAFCRMLGIECHNRLC